MSNILTNITDIRRKKGISINRLAAAIGVSHKTYIRIETGEIPLSYFDLVSIARVFQMPLTEVINYETREEKEKRAWEEHKKSVEEALNLACSLLINKPFECKVLENYYREKFAKENLQTSTQP